MSRRLFLCLLSLALCGSAAAQDAISADDIVARNTAARGGIDKIRAIQSLRITGKGIAPTGQEFAMSMYVRRPAAMRMEMSFMGQSIVQAFDGSEAWSINPLSGTPGALRSSEEQSKSIRDNAASMLDGILVDYKAKGAKVELMGKEDVDGSPAYKLKVTTRQGTTIYDYLNSESYLEVRTSAEMTQQGQSMTIDTYPSNYKTVNGVMMAHSLDQRLNGQSMMKISMDKVEANVPLEDGLFRFPATPGEQAK